MSLWALSFFLPVHVTKVRYINYQPSPNNSELSCRYYLCPFRTGHSYITRVQKSRSHIQILLLRWFMPTALASLEDPLSPVLLAKEVTHKNILMGNKNTFEAIHVSLSLFLGYTDLVLYPILHDMLKESFSILATFGGLICYCCKCHTQNQTYILNVA